MGITWQLLTNARIAGALLRPSGWKSAFESLP
jgi:hypothetical protein